MANEFKIKNGFVIGTGSTYDNPINEVSTDPTLGSDSDTAVVSEKAIKAYVDANSGVISSGNFLGLTDTPDVYTGNEGKRVTVNNDGDGLIFTEESGLGIASAKYKFNNITSGGDPTSGHASLNNADPALATEIYISKTDINGADKTYGLGLLNKHDFIGLADRNSTDHHNFKLTEKGVDSGTYFTYSNVISTSSIGAHNNNENIYVEAYMTGAKNFTGLLDTPDSYTSNSGKIPSVKADESGLEFIDAPYPSKGHWAINTSHPSNSGEWFETGITATHIGNNWSLDTTVANTGLAFVVPSGQHITVSNDPTENMAIATKQYVDSNGGGQWEQGTSSVFIKPKNGKLIEVNAMNDFGGVINAAPLAPDISGGIQVSDVGGTKTGANGHYTFVSNDLYKHDANDFYVLRLVEPNMWVVSEDSNTSAPAHDMTKVVSYKFTSPENGLGHYYGFNGNTHALVGDTNDKKFFNAISTTGTIYSDTDIKANERFIVGHGAVFEHNADGGVNIIGVPNISGVPFSVFSANTEIFRITSTGTVLAPGSTISGLTQKKELVTKEYVDTMVMTKAMTIAEPQPGDHFTMWITDNPIIIEKVMAISSNGDTTFNITGSVTGDIFSTAQTCNTVPVVHSPDQNQTIGALATISVSVNTTTVSNGHFNVTVHYRYVG